MVDLATAFVLVLSVLIWGAALRVLYAVWRRRQAIHSDDERYELDPEDGCGCVGIWEYTSERRAESEGDEPSTGT